MPKNVILLIGATLNNKLALRWPIVCKMIILLIGAIMLEQRINASSDQFDVDPTLVQRVHPKDR